MWEEPGQAGSRIHKKFQWLGQEDQQIILNGWNEQYDLPLWTAN